MANQEFILLDHMLVNPSGKSENSDLKAGKGDHSI